MVLVLVGMKRCLRECPSVPDHTLNSKTSPFASASPTSSFQSMCCVKSLSTLSASLIRRFLQERPPGFRRRYPSFFPSIRA